MSNRASCFVAVWIMVFSSPAQTILPLVSHSGTWSYYRGTNTPQTGWMTLPDNQLNNSWVSGNGGFGYADAGGQETNDCLTLLPDMKNGYTTVYIRKQFEWTNTLSGSERLRLRMDWDDGFIAWLDGRPLTNRNVTDAPNEPSFKATASASHEASLGTGGQPAEVYDLGPATNWLSLGIHHLAVIGLNQSSNSTDFILVTDLYLEQPSQPLVIVSNTTWSATLSPLDLTNDVVVAPEATLTIEPGTILRFRQGRGMIVQGRLIAQGKSTEPIRFTRFPGDPHWERLLFHKSAPSELAYCVFEFSNCVGDHKDYYPTNCATGEKAPRKYHEAVVVLASHVDFDSCSFTNLPNASATAEGDALAIISDDPDVTGQASASVRNCSFIRIGQGVHTRFASVLVENCEFRDKHGDNDDVDLYGESEPASIIRSNRFLFPSYDDRINPTRSSALIYGNLIYGSTDHGIVLRDISRPIVFNNVLYSCTAGGISVQNGCEAIIANNTLFNCPNAIKMFDHLDRISPPYCLSSASGKAILINNIIWNSTPALNLAGNAFGTLQADVSWCNIQGGIANANIGAKGQLNEGAGNLDNDPLFRDAARADFRLSANSPCVDVGTNLANFVETDAEGTPRPLDGNGDKLPAFDIGAHEFLLESADSNADGLPDGWCRWFGFNPLTSGLASADTDGDSLDNLGEYFADTIPTNASSRFAIESVRGQSPSEITFLSSSNRFYTLLYSTQLYDGVWHVLPGQEKVRGTGGQTTLLDTNTASSPQKLYRLMAVP